MTAGSMVVDRDDRIVVRLRNRTNDIRHTLLHFRIGALHGIQLDTARILSRIHRRDCATAHTDAVVITTQNYHVFTRLRVAFQRIALVGKADTTGQHDNFVVGILLVILGVLESQQRTANQRLAKLVSEV